MKLLNYFSMVKYMICTDVKLCIFFYSLRRQGKLQEINQISEFIIKLLFLFSIRQKKRFFLSFLVVSIWLV